MVKMVTICIELFSLLGCSSQNWIFYGFIGPLVRVFLVHYFSVGLHGMLSILGVVFYLMTDGNTLCEFQLQ